MQKNKACCCPHCEKELKNGCFSPSFCKPCRINEKQAGDFKICPECKAEYLTQYEECPSCKTTMING
ncbi:MAG: hypothetical protein FWD54_02950 [Endomicrobia bacterium]|nr:hypothetical protein [Endomicrobiia bacterium]MCL2799222.1 hypothetical protein [Endomicrobiia bacterium]